MSRVKLVIFDLDGTLVDAYKAVWLSLNFALKKARLPAIDYRTVKRSVGWGEKILVASFVSPHLQEKALAFYRRHHKKALKTGTKLLPGAKNILECLRKKDFKLAIASNRPTFFTRAILRHLKILKYFDCVLCADKVKRPKPHPDLFREILKRLKMKPNETVYVGDMVIDVQAGKRAKIKTIAVATGSSTKAELRCAKPFKLIDNLSGIKGSFKGAKLP